MKNNFLVQATMQILMNLALDIVMSDVVSEHRKLSSQHSWVQVLALTLFMLTTIGPPNSRRKYK